jgi:tetraacyldisaccharide 4'-kinase
MTGVAARLSRTWYAPAATPLAQLLRPLSWLFGGVAATRRAAYRHGMLRSARPRVPVVIVGNITVGGAGKTPLVAALVEAMRERGWRPGIVSRGYGRRTTDTRAVRASDDARETGDEPLILAATGVPVWVGASRASAVQALLAAHPEVNVIVADDGLQHYALARDVEIAVVDATRGLGNRLLLPAGPLREPPSRLDTVDAVVHSSRAGVPEVAARSTHRIFTMTQHAEPWRNVADLRLAFDARLLRDEATVAIAGIADPHRFFDSLRAVGFAGRTQAFADHHRYSRDDVRFPGAPAVLMTQKDAVKCRAFGDARMWMLPIRAQIDESLVDLVVEKLDGSETARDARLSRHQGTADP